jgi:L-2-hydroxyglutarate oxidase LhgO
VDSSRIDIAVIGAGVVGVCIARSLARSAKSLFIFEKNHTFGEETSSRNSEVIHAGIYYTPGSLKATLCVEGRTKLYDYLETRAIPHKKIGKLIVACDRSEMATIERLYANGTANGVTDLEIIDEKALHSFEARVAGVGALWSPSTGIFDTHAYMKSVWHEARTRGAEILYNARVTRVQKEKKEYRIIYQNAQGESETCSARIVINAAGLDADSVSESMGIDILRAGYTLHYCKGEYFRIVSEKRKALSHLVYPVPGDVALGVHLTPDLAGGVRIGPNATYTNTRAKEYAVSETEGEHFLKSAQRIFPELVRSDITPDIAGYRPKLQAPGEKEKDFIITHEINRGLAGIFNLIGIESPGLTASLAIAERVKGMIDEWDETRSAEKGT